MTDRAALASARKESASLLASQSVILLSSRRMSGLEMPNLPPFGMTCPARRLKPRALLYCDDDAATLGAPCLAGGIRF